MKSTLPTSQDGPSCTQGLTVVEEYQLIHPLKCTYSADHTYKNYQDDGDYVFLISVGSNGGTFNPRFSIKAFPNAMNRVTRWCEDKRHQQVVWQARYLNAVLTGHYEWMNNIAMSGLIKEKCAVDAHHWKHCLMDNRFGRKRI